MPRVFVVCGPSGSGKSTVCGKLFGASGKELFKVGVSEEDVTTERKEQTIASGPLQGCVVVDMPGHDVKTFLIPQTYREKFDIVVIVLALTEKKKPVAELCAKLNVPFVSANVFVSPRAGESIVASGWLQSCAQLEAVIANPLSLKAHRQPRVLVVPPPSLHVHRASAPTGSRFEVTLRHAIPIPLPASKRTNGVGQMIAAVAHSWSAADVARRRKPGNDLLAWLVHRVEAAAMLADVNLAHALENERICEFLAHQKDGGEIDAIFHRLYPGQGDSLNRETKADLFEAVLDECFALSGANKKFLLPLIDAFLVDCAVHCKTIC